MKGGARNLPDSEIETGNLTPDEMSTNQEGTVVPWFAGEQIFALRWISPVYDQFTREAPNDRPGKK